MGEVELPGRSGRSGLFWVPFGFVATDFRNHLPVASRTRQARWVAPLDGLIPRGGTPHSLILLQALKARQSLWRLHSNRECKSPAEMLGAWPNSRPVEMLTMPSQVSTVFCHA